MTKGSFRLLCGAIWGVYCHGIVEIVLSGTLALLSITTYQLLLGEVHVTYFLYAVSLIS